VFFHLRIRVEILFAAVCASLPPAIVEALTQGGRSLIFFPQLLPLVKRAGFFPVDLLLFYGVDLNETTRMMSIRLSLLSCRPVPAPTEAPPPLFSTQKGLFFR